MSKKHSHKNDTTIQDVNHLSTSNVTFQQDFPEKDLSQVVPSSPGSVIPNYDVEEAKKYTTANYVDPITSENIIKKAKNDIYINNLKIAAVVFILLFILVLLFKRLKMGVIKIIAYSIIICFIIYIIGGALSGLDNAISSLPWWVLTIVAFTAITLYIYYTDKKNNSN